MTTAQRIMSLLRWAVSLAPGKPHRPSAWPLGSKCDCLTMKWAASGRFSLTVWWPFTTRPVAFRPRCLCCGRDVTWSEKEGCPLFMERWMKGSVLEVRLWSCFSGSCRDACLGDVTTTSSFTEAFNLEVFLQNVCIFSAQLLWFWVFHAFSVFFFKTGS